MTKKLSKANDGVNPSAQKELPHVIKYVLEMKNLSPKIEPTRMYQSLGDQSPKGVSHFSAQRLSM